MKFQVICMCRKPRLSEPGCWHWPSLLKLRYYAHCWCSNKVDKSPTVILSCFYSKMETCYCMFYLSAKSNRFFHLKKEFVFLSSFGVQQLSSLRVLKNVFEDCLLWTLTVPLAMHVKISSIFHTYFCATEVRLQLCWQFFWLQRYILREPGQISLLFVLPAKAELKQLISLFWNESSFFSSLW